jgi:hypothetical protein
MNPFGPTNDEGGTREPDGLRRPTQRELVRGCGHKQVLDAMTRALLGWESRQPTPSW